MRNDEISEIELRNKFIESYDIRENIRLFLEVPVFSRSVDLVIQNTNDKSLMAIEFKMHDWKRAIEQVHSVALCFDYLCICLPKPKTDKGVSAIVDACSFNGVGLYFYDVSCDKFDYILYSQKVSTIWDAQKRKIVGYLEAVEHERRASNSKV